MVHTSPQAQPRRYRAWIYVLNNYTPSNISYLQQLSPANPLQQSVCAEKVVYHIYGEEVGDTGTPHLQGYIYFKHAKAFEAVRSILCTGSHLESARGTPLQNKKYSSKEGKVWEGGDIPKSLGERATMQKERWSEILDLAKDGAMDDIAERYPDAYIRYYTTLYHIKKRYAKRPSDLQHDPKLCNTWYWGSAGVGKSRRARHENPDYFVKNLNKWWDCYHEEDRIILDDFSRDSAKYLSTHLKLWADRYAFVGEVKGSAEWMRPKHICVTSNYHPKDLWPEDQELRQAIERRFKIIHMRTRWTPDPLANLVREPHGSGLGVGLDDGTRAGDIQMSA